MGTHPIFESDFDCLTECHQPNLIQLPKRLKKLSKEPSNDEKLQVYSLYKQCTVGDCNTDKPGMLDMKGKAKWEAWNKLKGMSQAGADAAYIKLVADLKTKY